MFLVLVVHIFNELGNTTCNQEWQIRGTTSDIGKRYTWKPIQIVIHGKHWQRRKKSERKKLNKKWKSIYGNRRTEELSIISWNAGATYLMNQMNEVKWLLDEFNPHILFLPESNLLRSHDRDKVEIEGYTLHTSLMIRNADRQTSRIVAYVKEGIIVRRREDLELDDFSSIWLEAGLPRQKKFLVCGVYREWAHLKRGEETEEDSGSRQEQEERWNNFLEKWEDALEEQPDVTVLGDINIDLNKAFNTRGHTCKKMAEELKQRILNRGIVQKIEENTRYVSSCEPSLIDHIYMTRPELGTSLVHNWGTSDHRVIELKKKTKGFIPQATRLRKRVFKNFSRNKFIEDVKNIKWWKKVYSEEDPDKATENWEEEFCKVLDKHCPVKAIETKKNYTPWMTKELQEKSKSLQDKRKSLKDNWNKEEEKAIAAEAKILKQMLQNAEEKWKNEESRKMRKDEAKSWKRIKSWLGWKNTSQPEQLRNPENGKISLSAKENCKIMNNFYLNKVKEIKENMPTIEEDPCEELDAMIKFKEDEKEGFSMRPVTPEQVLEIGKTMKKSTSMGRDDIPADLFLLALPHMLPAVTHLINLSLRDNKFPKAWKVSKICPLFKGGNEDKLAPKMYRPVALLPVAARLLEKIVCYQAMEYMEKKQLMHSHNHGYRKAHGTITAVLEAQEEAMLAMEEGTTMGMITLDQSAAFDVIEHNILETKMRKHLFNEGTLAWFRDYLTDRQQYVALQSSRSETEEVGPYACPQGSSLGPFIWNMYCGEICEVLAIKGREDHEEAEEIGNRIEIKNTSRMGELFQFADDLMVLIRGITVRAVGERATQIFSMLSTWFLKNRLKLNGSKTHFMYIMTSQRATGKNLSDPIQFGNDVVQPVKSERMLGITIEGSMSMQSHLISGEKAVAKQIASKMQGLWLLKRHLTFKARKASAWGLVMSRMLYGIEVWGPAATENQLKKMQTIQNSILRFICNARRGTRTRDLLREAGMLSVRQLVVYRVLKTGLTAVWNKNPKKMSQWDARVERRLLTTKRSFRFMFGELLEKIPQEIRTENPKKINKSLKNWIKENIPEESRWDMIEDNGDGDTDEDGDI